MIFELIVFKKDPSLNRLIDLTGYGCADVFEPVDDYKDITFYEILVSY